MSLQFILQGMLNKLALKRDHLFCYVTMCFGPMAFFGEARAMSVYLPLIAITAIALYRTNVDFGKIDKWGIYSFAFIGLYGLASTSWSIAPLISLNIACRLLPLMISIVALILIFNTQSIKLLAIFRKGLLSGYIFLILIVTIDLITWGEVSNLQNSVTGKSSKWFYTHSSASLVIVCCFIWPVINYLRIQHNKRFAAVLFLLALFLPFIIQHMSARVSIISSSLVFVMVYKWPQFTLKILAVSIIGYLFTSPFIHTITFDQMVNLWHVHLYKISHVSALHRIYIWSYVSDLILQKPFWGWGLNAAKFLSGARHHLPPYYFELLPNHPHNGALQIWLELGLAGVIAFGILIVNLFKILLRITDRFYQAAASAAFVGALTVFSVSFGIWQNWWFATLGLLFISFIKPPATDAI